MRTITEVRRLSRLGHCSNGVCSQCPRLHVSVAFMINTQVLTMGFCPETSEIVVRHVTCRTTETCSVSWCQWVATFAEGRRLCFYLCSSVRLSFVWLAVNQLLVSELVVYLLFLRPGRRVPKCYCSCWSYERILMKFLWVGHGLISVQSWIGDRDPDPGIF